jgi:hypothetical protein
MITSRTCVLLAFRLLFELQTLTHDTVLSGWPLLQTVQLTSLSMIMHLRLIECYYLQNEPQPSSLQLPAGAPSPQRLDSRESNAIVLWRLLSVSLPRLHSFECFTYSLSFLALNLAIRPLFLPVSVLLSIHPRVQIMISIPLMHNRRFGDTVPLVHGMRLWIVHPPLHQFVCP